MQTEIECAALLAQAMELPLQTLPTPARNESDPPSKKPKIPKVSDLVIIQGPKPPVPLRASDGNIHVWIYKVCDDASYLWDDAKGVAEPLWQIQFQHDAPDSVCVNMYDKFSKFLSEGENYPNTLDELKHKALIKLVISGNDDPDNIGYLRYRTALYVVGPETALKNALYLLDEFWQFVHKDKEYNSTVDVHPHFGINVDECWDNWSFPNYTLHPSERALKVSCLACQPVQGKRVLTMTVQIDGEVANIVFSGAIWNWRDRFDAESIGSFRDESNKPFRVIPKADLSKVAEMIPMLFSNCVMRVVVDGVYKPCSKVDGFVSKLKENPQLFFV